MWLAKIKGVDAPTSVSISFVVQEVIEDMQPQTYPNIDHAAKESGLGNACSPMHPPRVHIRLIFPNQFPIKRLCNAQKHQQYSPKKGG